MLVGYARVSTQDQDLSLQLDALQAAGCDKVYTEKASGAQRNRPQLQAALDYMRGKDTLVVWKLDRLARSLKQLIETVEELGERGIGLRSLTEALDTTTSGGKLVFHLFAALAEFERSIIRERTRSGLQAARRRGRLGGRPPICAYLRPFPPTYPSRHLLLTAETWASSLCQPCPHSAFLMPPTPRPATQKAAQTWEARLEAGL